MLIVCEVVSIFFLVPFKFVVFSSFFPFGII